MSDFCAIHEASLTTQGVLYVIQIIRAGVPATDVSRLAQLMGTTKEHLIKILDLPRATVNRKARALQNLSSEQSERVVGMAKLVGQVQAMAERSGDPTNFNAAQWVAQWLEQRSQALVGRRPAE
ncbi:antitoxin Xre-like helix-turn-helix domain-containing protein [Cupriavidus basilensis]